MTIYRLENNSRVLATLSPFMTSETQEVIDLTQSPQREVIVLDSDDEPQSTSRYRKPSSKRDTNKVTLLDRITNASGEKVMQESGESSKAGDNTKKKRKKKKKKATVVVEDGEIELEDEEGSGEEDEELSGEKVNGHSAKGKDRDDKRISGSSKNGLSLLERIAGVEHPAEPSSSKRKNSDISARPQEDTKDSERSAKKRKRKERDRDRDRSHSPHPRRRSRSPERNREGGPSSSTAKDSTSSLFFIDLKPVEIPAAIKISVAAQPVPSGSGSGSNSLEEESGQKLLLPSHVSLLEDATGAVPVEILPPEPLDSDEEDYIDYLDYGDDNRKVRERRHTFKYQTIKFNVGSWSGSLF